MVGAARIELATSAVSGQNVCSGSALISNDGVVLGQRPIMPARSLTARSRPRVVGSPGPEDPPLATSTGPVPAPDMSESRAGRAGAGRIVVRHPAGSHARGEDLVLVVPSGRGHRSSAPVLRDQEPHQSAGYGKTNRGPGAGRLVWCECFGGSSVPWAVAGRGPSTAGKGPRRAQCPSPGSPAEGRLETVRKILTAWALVAPWLRGLCLGRSWPSALP